MAATGQGDDPDPHIPICRRIVPQVRLACRCSERGRAEYSPRKHASVAGHTTSTHHHIHCTAARDIPHTHPSFHHHNRRSIQLVHRGQAGFQGSQVRGRVQPPSSPTHLRRHQRQTAQRATPTRGDLFDSYAKHSMFPSLCQHQRP